MTKASPTAASAAAMAIEKIATITPVGRCGSGLKRQNAMKFRFAAATIISIPIKMKIAWRRLSAASKPIENNAAEMMRKSWRVGVIAVLTENAEHPTPNTEHRTQTRSSIQYWALGAAPASLSRKHCGQVRRWAFASSASSFLLHHKNQRTDEGGGEKKTNA